MSLITVTIFFSCCFFVAVNGYATCGIGIWAGTTCVELSQCSQLSQPMAQLHQTNAIQHTSFMANRVRPAMCGFNRDMPMICCPNDAMGTATEKTESHYTGSCGNVIWHKSLSPDGMPAELEEFPWLALLEYETEYGRKFGCGGVLISDRHVLTAAHCLNPFGSKLVSVRLGEHDIRTAEDCHYDPYSPYCSKAAIDIGIELEIPHEKYSNLWGASDFDSLSYDIAVIKLNRSVITNIIKPICLPDQHQPSQHLLPKIDILGKFISAGWGVVQDAPYPTSYVKLMSRMKQVSKLLCNLKYSYSLHEDTICALAKLPKYACIGDSGGPLMGFNKQSKMTVMGLYSPVDDRPCTKLGVPSTFVDVSRYVDWIQMQMRY